MKLKILIFLVFLPLGLISQQKKYRWAMGPVIGEPVNGFTFQRTLKNKFRISFDAGLSELFYKDGYWVDKYSINPDRFGHDLMLSSSINLHYYHKKERSHSKYGLEHIFGFQSRYVVNQIYQEGNTCVNCFDYIEEKKGLSSAGLSYFFTAFRQTRIIDLYAGPGFFFNIMSLMDEEISQPINLQFRLAMLIHFGDDCDCPD